MVEFWHLYSRSRSAVLGLGILLVVVFLAAIANFIYPEDPFRLAGQPISVPGANGFLLGSDTLGRDVASGIAHGAKTSLLIGLVATLAAVFIGIIFGAFAGYYGGRVDDLLMRVTEIFQTIPSFVFAILLVAIMKPSIESIVIAITVVSWPGVARFTRAEFLKVRNMDYVTAAEALGFSSTRTIFRHVLPNAIAPVLVISAFGIASAILTESALSFLGFGSASTVSWGSILSVARGATYAWWMAVFPGTAIFITVTVYNLLGEGLRDALDPRLK